MSRPFLRGSLKLPISAAAAIVIAFSLGVRPAHAQATQAPGWLAELNALESSTSAGSPDARRARLAVVRKEIDQWLALHPATALDVAPAPAQPWSDADVQSQIAILKKAVRELLRRDPNRPFYLGVVVDVTAPNAVLSPITDTMDHVEIQSRQALTVNQAIEYLPGVAVDHKAPRNQTGISIGGFDSRQVPLYIDGIPAYVPFDGYVDLTRYLTSDVAEIQVAKGYSSPLLGPNLLGGVVNLVTREPQKRLEGNLFVGGGSGSQMNSELHVGSRWSRGFLQASDDRLHSDFYPLSGSFAPTTLQPDRHRANSAQHDDRFQLRLGWTPRAQDSYVVSYANQAGTLGIPPYAGSAPPCPPGSATTATPCVTPKFWQWPVWNTDGYYFNSRTAVGGVGTAHLRAFYVRFDNRLAMFDDGTYATQKASSSGTLDDHDRSAGVAGDFETRLIPRHVLGGSFFLKHDTHTERTTTFSTSNIATTTPAQTDRDRQASFGIQDVVTLTAGLRATLGLSADQLRGLEAQDLSGDKSRVVPFQVAGVCAAAGNAAFDSCTSRLWVYNPVASLAYTSSPVGTVFVTFAEKSRFPSLKDRYSYKAGRAVPNPMLRPERARTWTVGYARALLAATVVQVEVFRSRVRDEIENIFFSSPLCASGKAGAGTCQQAVNAGVELHQGVNVTLRTTLAGRLTVDANYSFLHREISGTPGVFPTGAPTHKAVGTASVRVARGVTLMASARHQSGAVAMSDNGLPLPVSRFTTVDVSAVLPVRAGVNAQLGIQNVFDRNYFYWEGFPEEGRHWYATVRWIF